MSASCGRLVIVCHHDQHSIHMDPVIMHDAAWARAPEQLSGHCQGAHCPAGPLSFPVSFPAFRCQLSVPFFSIPFLQQSAVLETS